MYEKRFEIYEYARITRKSTYVWYMALTCLIAAGKTFAL